MRSLVGQVRRGDSGAPSTHSLTITFDVLASTCGTKNSATAGEALGRLLLGRGLQGVVELLADPRGQLRRPAALTSMPPASGATTFDSRPICFRSDRSASSAPGYCTLTATGRPSRQVARWT